MYGLPENVRVWACDASMHLSFPSIGFVCFCMSDVISSFRSLRARSQVFALQILLAVCMLVGMVVRAKADSVSFMNCVQSAFL